MAKTFLKSIAITIGAGLAVGLGSTLGRRWQRRRDGGVDLAPIADRLDGIEGRIGKVETSFTAPMPVSMPEFETRLASQTRDMELVRREIRSVDARSAEQLNVFHQKLTAMENRLPEIVENAVEDRIAALERRLQAGLRETQERTIAMFAETIETKIVNRIAALEHNMAEQSSSIAALRDKTLKTDENLQRLLTAVERLCTQTAAPAMAAARPLAPELAPLRERESAEPGVATFAAHMARELGRDDITMPAAEPAHSRVPVAFSLIAISLGLLRVLR